LRHFTDIKWDDSLSKLIGKQSSDESEDIPEEDDEMEPNHPANATNAFSEDFEYDAHDPAGLRITDLSISDAAWYHYVKYECMKADQLGA
jgi:hypothetical protein